MVASQVFNKGKMGKEFIVASCNGLLLVCKEGHGGFEGLALWNSTAGEKKSFPNCLFQTRSDQNQGFKYFTQSFGFGFDAEAKDYKVVIMHMFYQ